MKSLIGVCFMIASIVLVEGQQRVAPGVPPQQYQQQYAPPPPQQHQQMQPPQQQIPNQVPQMQQQVQYQQVPVQQQQIPQQQIPQQHIPVQQQQVPVHPQQGGHPQGGHPQGGHGHGHHQQQLLNSANIMQEKQHIAEHADIPIDVSKMSEQELQFHYFKMHDADRNDKLDGCELIKSLIHWHGEANPPATGEEAPQIHTDQELESMVDGILKELDKNNDGYIDFIEYKSASD